MAETSSGRPLPFSRRQAPGLRTAPNDAGDEPGFSRCSVKALGMHVCEQCGESNPVANRFCLQCGAELPDATKAPAGETAVPVAESAEELADDAVIDQFDTSALRFP